jgi:hypothetical protein
MHYVWPSILLMIGMMLKGKSSNHEMHPSNLVNLNPTTKMYNYIL